MIATEIILGFTPAGLAIDIKDLAVGIKERDPTMIAFAGIGFIPGLGDIYFKKLHIKQLEQEMPLPSNFARRGKLLMP